MRAEALWRELGSRVAEGMAQEGVRNDVSTGWGADWTRVLDRSLKGDVTVSRGVADLVTLLTIARELVGLVGE